MWLPLLPFSSSKHGGNAPHAAILWIGPIRPVLVIAELEEKPRC